MDISFLHRERARARIRGLWKKLAAGPIGPEWQLITDDSLLPVADLVSYGLVSGDRNEGIDQLSETSLPYLGLDCERDMVCWSSPGREVVQPSTAYLSSGPMGSSHKKERLVLSPLAERYSRSSLDWARKRRRKRTSGSTHIWILDDSLLAQAIVKERLSQV